MLPMHEVIRVPYNTLPHMRRRENAIALEPITEEMLTHKREILATHQDRCCAQTTDADAVIRELASQLGLSETHEISELCLQFNEDLCILSRTEGIRAICFTSPSRWIPGQALGRGLADLHAHVADNARLLSVSDHITKAITDASHHGFHRFVWTITAESSLAQWPEQSQPQFAELSDLWFRTEYQMTSAFMQDHCAFFVRVQHMNLSELWVDHRELIQNSLNSMSDAVVDYKNLRKIREFLQHQ